MCMAPFFHSEIFIFILFYSVLRPVCCVLKTYNYVISVCLFIMCMTLSRVFSSRLARKSPENVQSLLSQIARGLSGVQCMSESSLCFQVYQIYFCGYHKITATNIRRNDFEAIQRFSKAFCDSPPSSPPSIVLTALLWIQHVEAILMLQCRSGNREAATCSCTSLLKWQHHQPGKVQNSDTLEKSCKWFQGQDRSK